LVGFVIGAVLGLKNIDLSSSTDIDEITGTASEDAMLQPSVLQTQLQEEAASQEEKKPSEALSNLSQEASQFQSAQDFATIQGTSTDRQIGAVDSKKITPRDNVDKSTDSYKSLVESIKKDGIKEPVIVTSENGKLTTFEGSHRVTAAQELGIDVPVIVTEGSLEGLQTIEEFYQESKKTEKVEAKPPTPTGKIETTTKSSLVEEAKKYKSADEFVKAQGDVVYHGTNSASSIERDGFKVSRELKKGSSFIGDDQLNGTYFTRDKSQFGDNAPLGDVADVIESRLPKNIELVTVNSPKDLDDIVRDKFGRSVLPPTEKYNEETIRLLTKHFTDLGIDGVEIPSSKEMIIFNPSTVKTKSQLTDIYNQAKQTKPTETTKVDKPKPVKEAKKPPTKKKPPPKPTTPKSFTPKIVKPQPKLAPLKKEARKQIQEETKQAVFSGSTQEESVKSVEKFMKDTLNKADEPTFTKRLKAVRSELKRTMYEMLGVTTGHWKRDYSFFQQARNHPDLSDLVDTIEDSIFQIDEVVNRGAPSLMGGTLASSGGSQTIDTFENRSEPRGGTEEFKLFKKVQELTRKYAQSIGEGYLPRKTLGVYYTKTKNIRINAINNLSTAAHELTHFLDYQYNITDKLLAVDGFAPDGKPVYNESNKKIRDEITKVYEKYYPGGKKSHKLRKRAEEGFATLLQKYIETPNKISQEFPLLVDEFFIEGGRFYHPVVDEMIVDLNKIVEGYQGLSSLDKIGSKVTSENANIDKKSFLGFFDKVRTNLVDELYPIEVLAKKAGKSFTTQDPTLWLRAFNSVSGIINTNIAGKRGYWSLRGNTFKKLHDFNWKTLSDLVGERKISDDFGSYLVARREHFAYKELDVIKGELEDAKRVYNSVKEIDSKKYRSDEKYKNKFRDIISELDGFGIDSDTEIDVVKASMKLAFKRKTEAHAEFKGILDRDGFSRDEVDTAYKENELRFKEEEKMFDALTQADLDFMSSENVQLITPKQRNKLKSKQGYASFKRQFYDEIIGDSNEFPNTARIGGTRSSSLLKRKGSERTIINPLYSGMANHSEMMRKGLKQVVYNKITDIGISAAFPNLFQEQQLKAIPDPKTGAILYPQEKDNNIIMGRKNYKRAPVLVDNQVKVILDNILTYENIDTFEQLYVGLSRMFTAGTTGFYPAFAATNIVVDQITAMANTTNKYRPIYSAMVEFKNILKDKTSSEYKYYEEYLVMGGERQTFNGWQKLPPDQLFKAIKNERKGLKKAINLMEKGSDVLGIPSKYSEIVTRATEYVKARKSGKAQIVALEEAGRVTAPFHHMGKWGGKGGSTFIRGLPFFNATLQVLDQTLRTVETKGGRKRSAAVLLMITSAYLVAISKMLNADDEQKEQYKDLEPKELAGFLYFPHPSGKKLIRVKMSQTFSGIGTILNMIIADKVLGTNYSSKDFATASTAWLPDQFNPIEPVQAFLSWIPHVFSVGLETVFNVKSYPRVSPLESKGLQNLPPELRVNENTSAFAKWLGKKAGISPIKIDYLLTGYLGRSIGFATGKPSAYDFSSSVVRDYYFSGGRRVSGTYDLKEENDQNYNTLQSGLEAFNKEEAREIYRTKMLTNDFADLMGDYRKIDIEEDPEKAAEIRNEIIQIINQLDNGDEPKGLDKWIKKANKRRKDKIKDLKSEGILPDGKVMENEDFVTGLQVYAKAIDADLGTTFNRFITGQKIMQVSDGGIIVVKRQSVEDSEAYKAKWAREHDTVILDEPLRLDHTIPNKLGGSEKPSNWQVIPESQHASYTRTETDLIRAVKNKNIKLKEAQKLIVDFKEGKITREEVLEKINS